MPTKLIYYTKITITIEDEEVLEYLRDVQRIQEDQTLEETIENLLIRNAHVHFNP